MISLFLELGMSPAVANATNRVGVLAEAGFASWKFSKKASKISREIWLLILCSLPGTILGSYLALIIEARAFNLVMGILILVICLLTLLPQFSSKNVHFPPFLQIPFFFGVGVYAGFIQAGVGFLIIAAFRLLSLSDMLRATYYKTLLVVVLTLPALAYFIYNGVINWHYAFVLSLGTVVGAWLAVHVSQKYGDPFIKKAVVVFLLLLAIRLLSSAIWNQ